jgi:hypothetical protein
MIKVDVGHSHVGNSPTLCGEGGCNTQKNVYDEDIVNLLMLCVIYSS